GRPAAGDRGDQTAAGHRGSAQRPPAAFRRTRDALPRDPAGAGPGLRGVRARQDLPRLPRAAGALRTLRRQARRASTPVPTRAFLAAVAITAGTPGPGATTMKASDVMTRDVHVVDCD